MLFKLRDYILIISQVPKTSTKYIQIFAKQNGFKVTVILVRLSYLQSHS